LHPSSWHTRPPPRERDLEKPFESFWRKNPKAHSGLGLCIVQAYAGLLGGTIQPTLSRDGIFELKIVWAKNCSDSNQHVHSLSVSQTIEQFRVID